MSAPDSCECDKSVPICPQRVESATRDAFMEVPCLGCFEPHFPRLFPCDLARGRRLRDRARRHRQTNVPPASAHVRRALLLGRPCLLPDDDALSRGAPVHANRSLPRLTASERPLCTVVQPTPPPFRPPLRRPFTSTVIEGERYLQDACQYVVENPVRAGICDSPEAWPWAHSRYRRE